MVVWDRPPPRRNRQNREMPLRILFTLHRNTSLKRAGPPRLTTRVQFVKCGYWKRAAPRPVVPVTAGDRDRERRECLCMRSFDRPPALIGCAIMPAVEGTNQEGYDDLRASHLP